MKRRRDRPRFPLALAGSLAMHAGLVALAWATASRAAVVPPMRVYAVDIVSPPPQALGEFDPEPAAAAEPTPPAPTPPEPEPEPEPEPAPPEPEPSPAPPTKKTPKPEPAKPEPAKPKPAAEKPAPAKPAASAGTSTGSKTTPSTGRNPDPTSAGGEGLDYQLKGVQCPSPEYCNNIIRQVNRYFRSPSSGAAAEAEVYFVIERDGSISGLRVLRATGGAPFRLAVMEAVEQAGLNKAFGRLPETFGLDELPVSFYFRPAR